MLEEEPRDIRFRRELSLKQLEVKKEKDYLKKRDKNSDNQPREIRIRRKLS